MKVLAIISSVLILQTSASFFDEFRGAVSSVESSFGKLLSDVIYDVKETIDCTLLAVEQVLSLGMFSDSADYDRRCKEASAAVEQSAAVASEPASPPVLQVFTQKPVPVLTNKESRQTESPIQNEVVCDVFKKDDAHSQMETVKLALRNETARLNEISDLLRKQLEDLSNEVKEKFKAIELQTSEPSVETIWSDIKILHEIEHRHKDTAEARKISHILDQILNILDANGDRTTDDEYKIKEIMRKLSKHAKDGSSDLWKNADEYPKDFREYANKIFDESRGYILPDNSSEKLESVHIKIETTILDNKKEKPKALPENSSEKLESVHIKMETERRNEKVDDKKEKPKDITTAKPKQKKRKRRTTTTTTEKPLTIEELAAQYGSLFDVIPDIDSMAAENAKHIIEETKMNHIVMKSVNGFSSNNEINGAQDLFDVPEFLDAKK